MSQDPTERETQHLNQESLRKVTGKTPGLVLRTVRRALEELVARGQVRFRGDKRWRRCWLTDKGQTP